MPPVRANSPLRSKLTSRLFARSEQRQAALLETVRATVDQERIRRQRREMLLGLFFILVTVADGVLLYLLLSAPAH